ncbi:MAG: autotransporter domain-containing protein [Deltaproteobacteria bacterium]|nr:autotransporter domain-containing protein [Deltaproteobacteria bacterium]
MMRSKRDFSGHAFSWPLTLVSFVLAALLCLVCSKPAEAEIMFGDPDSPPSSYTGTLATVDTVDLGTVNGLTQFSGIPDPLGGLSGVIIRNDGTGPHGVSINGDNDTYSIIGGVKIDSISPGYYIGTGSGNYVILNANASVGVPWANTGSIYGGISYTSQEQEVENNTVVVNGIVGRNVYGALGFAESGMTVSGNKVIVNPGGTVNGADPEAGKVVGGVISYASSPSGFVATSGIVSDNDVTVGLLGGYDADIAIRTVIGGQHDSGDGAEVNANTVSILSGTIRGNVFGGKITGTGNLDGNNVTISGGTFGQDIVGGATGTGTVSGNTVDIANGIFNGVSLIVGGSNSSGDATGNNVSIEGNPNNAITGNITVKGAYSEGTGLVKDNSATVKNAQVAQIVGAQQWSASGTLQGNSVLLNNVEVSGNVYGGWGRDDAIVIQDNKVTIEGGTNIVLGNIYGGYHENGSSSATGNIIEILGGNNDLRGSVIAYGELNIKGGNNIFGSTVGTGLTGQDITISGGDSTFQADMAAAGGQININDATVRLGHIGISAAGVNVNDGGILDIGMSTVTMTASNISFNNNSILKIAYDGTVQGFIDAGSSGGVGFADGARIDLKPVAGNPTYWKGKELIKNAAAISGQGLIGSSFYEFEESCGGHCLAVKDRLSFGKALDDISGRLPVRKTPNLAAAFGLMDRIEASGENDALVTDLIGAIQNMETLDPREAELALRQLIGESVLNVSSGVASTALRTQGVVLNRLDRIREIEIDDLTPPAAGSGSELNRIWVGGFGVFADAKNRGDVFGYEYTGAGFAMGYDRRIDAVPGLRVGLSASFASADLDNNDGRTKADLDTNGLGVYGSYSPQNGVVFLDANVAYAHTKSEYTTNLVTGGIKDGSFGIDSWQFGLRAGAILRAGSVQIVPGLGVRYVTLSQDAWSEGLRAVPAGTAVANSFAKKTDHQVDIPLQVKFNSTLETETTLITPELRLGWTFAAKRPDNELNVGFVGSTQTARIVGLKPHANSLQAGAGLKVNTGGALDVFLNYDLDAAKDYRGHNGSLGVGFEF